MAGYNKDANVTFHSGSISIGTGKEYLSNGGANEINLYFSISEGGTFTAIVEAYMYETNTWYPWDVYQRPSFTLMNNGISSANNVYNVDVKGIDKLRVNLTAINGTLSCYGKAIG